MITATRRLPGFLFEDHTPVRDVLPRMDIALFAGFARRGPVNVAVAIEDAAQFEAVFGGAAPLAVDLDTQQTLFAQLAPVVRLFFENGGRRCWVVRLAGQAVANTFRLPGVLAPFALRARSGGSWSDGVTVSASLSSRRYAAVSCDLTAGTLELVGTPSAPLEPGDLLRLRWDPVAVEGYVAVDRVERIDATRTRITLSREAEWFDLDRVPLDNRGAVTFANGAVAAAEVDVRFASPADPDRELTLSVHIPPAAAPRPGEVMTARFGRDVLHFAVRDVSGLRDEGSPRETAVRLVGRGRWQRASAFRTELDLPSVERLTLDVWTRDGMAQPQRVERIGLASGHARHLGWLSDDARIFGGAEADLEPAGQSWWHDPTAALFPLAGPGSSKMCVPFGVTALPEHYLPAGIPAGTALERDGLVPFDTALFVDPSLAGSLASTVVTDAEFIRYLATRPRSLRGLHAAIGIEEVSMIAVPDAVQPGWLPMEYAAPLPPEKSDSIVKDSCPVDDFVDCGAIVGPGPRLIATRGTAGAIELEWSAAEMDTTFIVEESTSRDWRGAIEAFEGADGFVTLHGRRPGDYYYRVRGVGAHPTEWSNGVGVQVLPGAGWRAKRRAEYQDDVLLAAHCALLRLCAGRRDVMGVFSVPAHYREDAVAAHLDRLASVGAEPAARTRPQAHVMVPPLSLGEAEALGFAALYHGWIYSRDNGALALLAPDGAACGVLARRAIQRGAWVAPANEPLRGVVALHHSAPVEAWGPLQDLQVNVTRAHANGFLMLSADTLARDADVRPISVRRLLMLLRRMATRLGADFVFEPNDASFRRMVQRRFEAMLGEMFERGAFAGATAESAFQVVTAESLNTRQSLDLGRFIVELRVAPSRPLTFLTLRLVQTGERLTITGA